MEANTYFKGVAVGIASLLDDLTPPLVVVLSLVAASVILNVRLDEAYAVLALLSALLAYMTMTRSAPDSLIRDRDALGLGFVGRVLFAWVAICGVLLLIGFATKYTAHFSRRVLSLWLVITPALIVAARYSLRMFIVRRLLANGMARNAIILGVNDSSKRLAKNIETSPELGMQLGGFFDDRARSRLGELDQPVLGELADVAKYVHTHRTDLVFVALPIRHLERVMRVVGELQDTTASVYFVPDLFVFDLIQSQVRDIRGVPVVSMFETPFSGQRYLAKRALDLVAASLGLLILSPVMLAIALGIKRSSSGPVFFKQRRYGMDGEEILVWKYRTMTVMEDGSRVVQASRDDPRITPFGRFLRQYSLDELPQLINVIRGEMSLVGPRPHAIAHNEEYRKLINGYMIRHKAIPGITGLAQVNGFRGETEKLEAMEGRVHYDLEYLRHWSVLLDLKILFRTVVMIFRDKNAY